MGADTHLTPREVIRDFIELLDILYQNPQVGVAELLQSDAFSGAVAAGGGTAADPLGSGPDEAQFAEFTI